MRAAHVKLTTTGHPSGMKTDAVDALSLGQMLVNQFAKAPVKSVVFNDEEGRLRPQGRSGHGHQL